MKIPDLRRGTWPQRSVIAFRPRMEILRSKAGKTARERVRFDIATKASWKNSESGEYDSRTEWHRIVVWANLTRFAQTLKKVEQVYVSGELRYREYDKEIGKSKGTVKIHDTEIRRHERAVQNDETVPE